MKSKRGTPVCRKIWKIKMPLDKPKFVKKSAGLHANVCKEIRRPPKINNPIPVSSQSKVHKIAFSIPDEYSFALMEMYGGVGLQKALMQHIKKTVKPIVINNCLSCEKGLCPDGSGGYIPCTLCGRVG
jgi:hypothetical protein